MVAGALTMKFVMHEKGPADSESVSVRTWKPQLFKQR